ncbi:MAG: C25 family cysteine peptidase [Ferruginibacter sp.]
MKKLLFVILAAFSFLQGSAQTYNNEWIDYSKTYYRFKVGATGLYRIPYSALNNIGLAATPVQNFQLWFNGVEVPMYTTVASGAMGASDYLEFYGQINDGSLDKKLYKYDSLQMSDKWSLYTDTAAYFLTVNAASANKRYTNPGNDVANNSLSPEPYFMYTLSRYFKDALNPGYAVNLGELIHSSSYETGEGWSSTELGFGKTSTTKNTGLYVYGSGPAANFTAIVAGNTASNRTVTVRLNTNVSAAAAVNSYSIASIKNNTISLSVLSADSATFAINHNGSFEDNIVIASYHLTYPRQFNFANTTQFYFEMPAGASKYIEISNFNAGVASPVLFDIANNLRITGVVAGGVAKFVLPAATAARKMVLFNANAVNTYAVNSFTQRNFVNYSLVANQGDYLIISHSSLLNDGSGNDYVEQYRQYRASVNGGSYNAKTIMIDQLIDQFAFGVKHHPMALRNFAAYSLAKFTIQPKLLFLVGKGITYFDLRRNEKNTLIEKYALVPTFGYPASDNLLTATRTGEYATIPIGRLSAVNGTEVGVYLNKVKEFETTQRNSAQTIEGKKWMKNVAHITGGLTDAGLAALIGYYMGGYKATASDSLFGADVYNFSKNSGLTTAAGSGKTLEKLFEEGLSMVTYFGHSSPNAIEFNLDNPGSYNNTGKYPLIIINGCNSGNLYTFDTLRPYSGGALSEKFVLADRKGSIAYIATTHFGLPTQLDYVNTSFYKNISKEMYGQPLGNLMKTTMQQVYTGHPSDFLAQTHVEEINLHGDPAIRMNPQEKPDFLTQDSLLNFSPSEISLADTKVKITAGLVNIGRGIKDSLTVRVQRKLPDNTIVLLGDYRIKTPAYSDSISLTLNLNPAVDRGTNQIIVTLDPENEVPELSELNNTVTKSFTIIEDEIRPVWPYNFSITDNSNPVLYGSVANANADIKEYVMQFDTTELFNSPFKITKTVLSRGGVLQFVPGAVLKDSSVYYWRLAVGPANANSRWLSSSFTYIKGGQDGFSQSHFYQYKKNALSGISIDSNTRRFGFDNITRQLIVRTGLYPYYNWDQININIDQEQVNAYGCMYSTLQFAVYDPVTLVPWKNYPVGNRGLYNSWEVCNPENGSRNIFEFLYTDSAYRRAAMDFIDAIPDGYYVSVTNLGYTGNTGFVNQWKSDTSRLGSGKSLWHKFHQNGLHQIDSFYKNLPFLFVFKKGDTTGFPVKQYVGSTYTQQVIGINNMPGNSVTGSMVSKWFGPVNFWNRFKWKEKVEGVSTTARSFDIIGLNTSGNEVQLAKVFNSKDTTIDFIDATVYPYLKIRMNNSDPQQVKTTQLNNWMLTSDNVPEGAISLHNLQSPADTLTQEDTLHLQARFVNLSNILFDSIKVKLRITNVDGGVTVYNNLPNGARYDQLLGGDSMLVNFDIPLSAYFGPLEVMLEINPDNDQPEMFHFNNYIFKEIYVLNGPVCSGSSPHYTAGNSKPGNTYQWQVNTGNGYTDVSDGELYAGAAVSNFQVKDIPSIMYGTKLRCKITNNSLVTYSPEYIIQFKSTWTGVVSSAWDNPGNWSCNKVPDENTDVVLPTVSVQPPVIENGVNAVSRSIKAAPGSSLQLNTGGKLDIKGPPVN